MSKRTEIAAVHEDQVESFFQHIGYGDDEARAMLVCDVCEGPVSDNLGAVRVVGGRFIFCCGRMECLERFSERD